MLSLFGTDLRRSGITALLVPVWFPLFGLCLSMNAGCLRTNSAIATGIAVMVGTGIATGVYRGISESTGWSIHSIATAVVATFTMCLLGGFTDLGVRMLIRITEFHLKLR